MNDPITETLLTKYSMNTTLDEANLLKSQVQQNIDKDVDISVEFPLAKKNKVEGQELQETRTVSDKVKDFGLDTLQAIPTGMESAGRNFNQFLGQVAAAPDMLADFLGQKIMDDPDYDYPGLDQETATRNIQSGLSWIDENLIPEFARGSTANIERKYTNEIYSGIIQGISEFATGAIPAAKIVGLTKGMYGLFAPNAAVRGLAWGGLADATVIDPDAPDLVDAVKGFVSGLDQEERGALLDTTMHIIEKHDPDSEILKRLKTANQGAIVGALVEGVIYGARILPWKTFTKALGLVGTASIAAGKKVVDTAKRIEIDDSTLGSTNIPLRLKDKDTFKEFPVPENPFKTTKFTPLVLTKDQLIEGAKKAESGKDWYDRHQLLLKDLLGDESQLFSDIIAITSQQKKVDENVRIALNVYDYFKTKETFANINEDMPELLLGVRQNLQRLDGSIPSATGARNVDKRIRERMGYDPTETGLGTSTYFGGNKIPDFVEAMRPEGTDEVITIDRHMIQLLFGKAEQVSASNILTAKQIITEIANELKWTPKETQAALWSFNQLKDSAIVKRKGVQLENVQDYKKALEKYADEIKNVRAKFQDTSGQGESISPRSDTSGEITEQVEKNNLKGSGTLYKQSGKLLEFLRRNPDGFTVAIGDQVVPNKGYSVAPLKIAEIVKDAKKINFSDLVKMSRNIKSMMQSSNQDTFAGGWLNPDDNKYYLDAVQVIDSFEEAIYIADVGDQKAIFNLETYETVNTKEAIEKLKKDGIYSAKAHDVARRNFNELSEKFRKARMGNK
tara:strand:+ start:897 stop:3269 length:2373 start_codon:yes stop_codon:yes gene_type:complete